MPVQHARLNGGLHVLMEGITINLHSRMPHVLKVKFETSCHKILDGNLGVNI